MGMIVMAPNKRWSDLTARENPVRGPGIIQVALLAAALVDIHRRPAEEMCGSRWL
jgi:hypothetical protein